LVDSFFFSAKVLVCVCVVDTVDTFVILFLSNKATKEHYTTLSSILSALCIVFLRYASLESLGRRSSKPNAGPIHGTDPPHIRALSFSLLRLCEKRKISSKKKNLEKKATRSYHWTKSMRDFLKDRNSSH
jgi:hypothetical protein